MRRESYYSSHLKARVVETSQGQSGNLQKAKATKKASFLLS